VNWFPWAFSAPPVGNSNVTNTRHNLSVTAPAPIVPGPVVTATSESQVCAFCHTPHGATNFPGAPLWNRTLSGEFYDVYTSESLDAEDLGTVSQPAGSSKLCLSCHDGTLALSTVNVLGNRVGVTVALTNTGAGDTMPTGAGVSTGNTRVLGGPMGTDLTNDHPISFTFDTPLAAADGELWDPASTAWLSVRSAGVFPQLPLEPTGPSGEPQVQCATCHDPHVEGTDLGQSLKFLRGHRLQLNQPVQGSYRPQLDMICLGCHDKEGWAGSAHADQLVANETYTAAGAASREFPTALPVWQAGCLNCHDPHTVEGARRLQRDGVDSLANAAVEETCFRCHTTGALSIVNNAAAEIPDIETEFALGIRMPITTGDQPAASEVHAVEDADLTEARATLGLNALGNRHAECTDCHNPHRLIRNQVYNGSGAGTSASHDHSAGHDNIASGALRGSWGVEPNYGASSFLSLPSSYTVVKGDPAVAVNPLTREYQVCLKCHSDYAYNDTGSFPDGGRPDLGSFANGTPSGTNNLTQYTNQAMEFQSPLADRGQPGGNHRSWHPVMVSTGRTGGNRTMGNTGNMFLSPWAGGTDVGSQTMFCSDCHGRNTGNTTSAPPAGRPWGPHGSENDFLLKGPWTADTGATANGLCFRCHNRAAYATEAHEGDDNGWESGFGGPDRDTNLHAYHAKQVGKALRCTWCHVAIPHGWKNKALLVNLNDVGSEAGVNGVDFNAVNGEVVISGNNSVFNAEPYYLNAKLKVLNWRTSGTWRDTDCGSEGSNNSGGNNTQTDKDWMGDVCSNPP
jgi:predicted CXXCH cytochrome family protein